MTAVAVDLHAVLHEVLSEIIESIAFVDVECTDEPYVTDEPVWWCKIGFTEPTVGHIVIAIPDDAIAEMADGAWGGEDAGDDLDAKRGFLDELGNMIAGQALARAWPDDAPAMTLPEVAFGPPPHPGSLTVWEVDGWSKLGATFEADGF